MGVLSERQKRELEIYAEIEPIGGMAGVSEPPNDEDAPEPQRKVTGKPGKPMSFDSIKNLFMGA